LTHADRFSLSGKVAVITGATKGIGRATAQAMAEAGARVVVSSRKADACEATRAELEDAGFDAIAIPCNISDTDQLAALVDGALAEWGRLDVLVPNAAVNPFYGSMAELPEEAYDKTMDSNVKNLLFLCNRALPHIAEAGGGSVVIVSSIAGYSGSDTLGVYALTKAADFQLARNMAVEWGRRNIRVNCIAPGLVRTDFARALWENPELLRGRLTTCPLGRIGEPEDIAGIALFLASDAARYVTGQVLTADGGIGICNGIYPEED
jgi:NAD(P)-dependent dehydrogenase (short-subunit alcohol dehydrogenase family)